MIIGEKQSILMLLDMIDFALNLLSLESSLVALDHYRSLSLKPVFASYIEDELLQLTWN